MRFLTNLFLSAAVLSIPFATPIDGAFALPPGELSGVRETLVAAGPVPQQSFIYPLVKTRLSSRFGARRHPIYKVTRHHAGIDLAAPRGTSIRAIAKGRVIFADTYAGYGKLVVIEHEFGLTSHYGHCNEITVDIGEPVAAGEIIGTVGRTGAATGPHLHLEIRASGKPQDPVRLIPGLVEEAQG